MRESLRWCVHFEDFTLIMHNTITAKFKVRGLNASVNSAGQNTIAPSKRNNIEAPEMYMGHFLFHRTRIKAAKAISREPIIIESISGFEISTGPRLSNSSSVGEGNRILGNSP